MNLRAKVASKASNLKKPIQSSSIDNQLSEDPKAFLHEYKESKREKQDTRSKEFLNRLSSKDDNLSGISKSSIRRRKRKQKAELLPKMQDLLTSLEDTTSDNKEEDKSDKFANINIVDRKTGNKYIEHVQKRKNLPNPKNQKGAKVIEKMEREKFVQVLQDPNFRANPFATLRESIAARLKNGTI